MATINFNANDVQPSSFEPLPAGTYEAVVSSSESKAMKSGNGMGFDFCYDIVSGPYTGRKVFGWITFEHRTSPQAQQIGREQLSSLCRAVGITQLNDTTQLHNLPLLITIGIDRNDPTRNVIKGFKAKTGTTAAPAKPVAQQSTGAAPWAR